MNESPLHQVANAYVQRKLYSSVEWALNIEGSTIDRGVVGYANTEAQTPVPNDALYRIYSMTKPIISVAAMQLIQQQRLHLFDPIQVYLPDFASPEILQPDGSMQPSRGMITVEHLMTHRAGFSYDFLPECPVAELYRQHQIAEDGSRSLADMVSAIAALPIAFEPGTQWRYSVATDVLARVLEVVTGQSIDQIIENQLLKPLGMANTAYTVTDADLPRLMPMYGVRSLGEMMAWPPAPQTLQLTDVAASHPPEAGTGFTRGGMGLLSTADDYLQFCHLLHTGEAPSGERLLLPTTLELLWANRLPESQRPMWIGPNMIAGYGWNLMGRVMLDLGQSMILTGVGEGGWSGAASTHFWVDRDRKMSGVMMSQYLGASMPLGSDMQQASYMTHDQYRLRGA